MVSADDAQIWTEQQGDGSDVVLISGLGASHEAWTDLAAAMAGGFRVTTLDNRGVGNSSAGSGDLSIRRFAGDVLEVMVTWEIENAHVIGSSMGGAIAQELALIRPAAVQSLSLVGTWCRPDLHLERLLRHMTRLVALVEKPRELLEALALWDYSGEAHADGTVDRLVAEALSSRLPEQSAETFARTAEAAIAHDAGDRLAALRVPTMIFVGSEDRICPPRLSEHLEDAIAGSHVRILPGRGHQPFQENPAEFLAAFQDFITVLSQPAATGSN